MTELEKKKAKVMDEQKEAEDRFMEKEGELMKKKEAIDANMKKIKKKCQEKLGNENFDNVVEVRYVSN